MWHSLTRLQRGDWLALVVINRQVVQLQHLAARRNSLDRRLVRRVRPAHVLAPPRMTARRRRSQSGMALPGSALTLEPIGR
jgi:hypothetical protein